MFWCSLKALWETRVDGKLSVLLKWVVQELELNSCHTPIELLSFMNYFPCHLEQEWYHGLGKLFVGCIHIQCFCSLLITAVNWSFQIFICLEALNVNKWVISLNVILKTLPPPLLAFPPPSPPSSYCILPAFSSSGKYINPRVSMRFPVRWHNQKILLTLPLGLQSGCYVVLVGVTQPSEESAQALNSEPEMH